MFVAIIDQRNAAGVVPVTQFQVAVDEAAAVAAYVDAFDPPLNPADWLGFDTGWSTYQVPVGGETYEWAYDFGLATLVEVLAPPAPSTVREKFFAAPQATSQLAFYPVQALPISVAARFAFSVPSDFVALVSLELMYACALADADYQLALSSDYSQPGEPIATHTEALTLSNLAIEAMTWKAEDISAVFSEIQPGDQCALAVLPLNIVAPLQALGIRLRYEAQND